ncbi:hypothetical protein DM01DRAFT_1340650 [Hesseltinella vesiculosa]|uniref:Uncharacterized protein n=1 Tax=Hesseltinella vesiculosa TaxID=101127 RepID=A0A1X2G3D0_9FUNG|nr:hypothetical protein DM01DRAFT_1340650 [Hesseltinella vesiculosa]
MLAFNLSSLAIFSLAFLSSIQALPVGQAPLQGSLFADSHSKHELHAPSTTQLATTVQEKSLKNASIDVLQFTSLVSSHIMIEHLDNAISVLSRKLATQIQEAVQLTSRTLAVHPAPLAASWVSDQVDIRLLHGQLQGAVGSFVQDQLPQLWNRHSTSPVLNPQPLRDAMSATLIEFCPPSAHHQQRPVISYQCLADHTVAFLTTMDDFMKKHLQHTLASLVQQDIPTLLTMANHHVDAILQHFNHYLLPPHSQLSINFQSLHDQIQDWSSPDNINQVLDAISLNEKSSDSFITSITQYAIQSKTDA